MADRYNPFGLDYLRGPADQPSYSVDSRWPDQPSVADAYRMGGLAATDQYSPTTYAPFDAYDRAQQQTHRDEKQAQSVQRSADVARGLSGQQGPVDIRPVLSGMRAADAIGEMVAPDNVFDAAGTFNPVRMLGKFGRAVPAAAGAVLGSDTAEAGVRTRLPPARAGKLGEVAAVDNWLPPRGHNNPPADFPAPTGSLNPLDNVDVTFRGKQLKEMTPEDMQAFGEHYGVKNLGPLSPLQTYKDMLGNEFQLPGGTGGNWTYADMLHMKANPINPANVDRTLHAEMQRKLGRTMTPEGGVASDADVFNGLVFGMTSPNNPLFPNQVSQSRLRLRSPEMLNDLASMIPWKPGEEVTPQARKLVSDNIAARFGLQAEPKGGLGTRGTADYSRVAEMAQMFRENPQFFRKADNESWSQAVERISSQIPGLSMKTGSFGTVWQDPAHAAISAIDRHMARELEKTGGLFADPAERAAWENQSVGRWNKREEKRVADAAKKGEDAAPADLATDFDNLMTKSGSDGHIGEMLLDHVGDAKTPKFRLATGEVNPNIPPHLQQAQWVREPETVYKMGRAYKQALDLNQKIADENGLNLFMSQWMEWDRIRNRFEPHENMFPGLSKLPAPSINQLREVDAAHRATGHKTYGKTDEGSLQPTRPLPGLPAQMGYLGLTGAIAPAVWPRQEEGAR
jgi:hypothetical protein